MSRKNEKHSEGLNEVIYYEDFKSLLYGIQKQYRDKPAVTCYTRKGQEVTHTFNQLKEDVESFGEALLLEGLGNCRMAIVSENSYEWLVAYLATVSSGGIAVCIDVEQADEVIIDMIRRADTNVIAVSSALHSVLKPYFDNDEKIKKVIVLDSEKTPYESMSQMQNKGRISLEKGSTLYKDIIIDPKQTAAIVYTSGTTNKAKPVMLSHYAIITNGTTSFSMIKVGEKSFGCLPFYHAYGFNLAILSSLVGGKHFCINGDLKTMLRDMQLFQPESVIAVPLIAETIYKMIWEKIEQAGKKKQVRSLLRIRRALGLKTLSRSSALYKEIRKSPIGSLKIIMCGGAYLAKNVAEDLEAFGILVLQGYGVTECAPLVSVNRNKGYSHTSVGVVIPGYDVKIKNDEILVKGRSLMTGYYNEPELTAAAMDDGWFKTGDIGYLDKNGHLHITGRIKNLIVLKNGKKISPEELESYFQNIPLIKEMIAYGAVNGDSADDVKAAIMVYPNPEITKDMSAYEVLEALQQEVNEVNKKLPIFKQIQMINIRESEFEKTSSRKIKR